MKKFAPFLVIVAGILWGSMGLFVRTFNAHGLATMEIVALRALVTSIVLFIVLLCYDKKLFKIKLKDIWCFIGTGVCSIAFFNFCYFKAITLTSMSVAAILMYTAPIIVMVLSFFLFKEAFTKRKIVGVILTFLGCICVTGVIGEGTTVTPAGFLLGMGAGLGYALYSIFSRYALQKEYHSLTITFYTFLLAAVVALLIADVPLIGAVVTQSVPMILLALGLGCACTVIPYLAYTIGLRHMENSKASIFATVEPVMATVFGAVVFQEGLTLFGVLGIVLVVVALFISRK